MLYLTDMLTARKLQALGLPIFEADAETIKSMLEEEEWQSRIKKQSNADLLSRILEMKIEVNKERVVIAELREHDVLVTFTVKKRSKKQNKDTVIFYFVLIM
jgi:hypothetical protein